MGILIKDNEASLINLSMGDFLKYKKNGVYTTMKTVGGYKYIFKFSEHMDNLHRYIIESLEKEIAETCDKNIIINNNNKLNVINKETIYTYCSKVLVKGFNLLENLNQEDKKKHFGETTEYLIAIIVSWEKNPLLHANEPLSIICLIKSIPVHPTNVQVEIRLGKRKHPNIKSTAIHKTREELITLKHEDTHEIILYDENGEISEGLSSNFFCFFNEKLHTAPDNVILKGTMRKTIIELCQRDQIIQVEKKVLHVKDLHSYEFCFISSTSRNIIPISKILLVATNRTILLEKKTDHPILIQLIEALKREVENKKESYDQYM